MYAKEVNQIQLAFTSASVVSRFTNMPINNTIPQGDYKHP